MNYRRAATAAAAGAMALGLAACTGGPKPTPTDTMPITTPTTTGTSASTTGSTPTSSTTAPPSTSSAPSTTSTPGVPPPVANIPPAARPNTKAGAQEFVRYYMDQIVASWSSANPKLLEGLWSSQCEWCSRISATAEEFQRLGDRYIGSPLDVKFVQFLDQEQDFTVILVIGDIPKAKVVKADGSTRREINHKYVTFEVTCSFKGHWQAMQVKSVGR